MSIRSPRISNFRHEILHIQKPTPRVRKNPAVDLKIKESCGNDSLILKYLTEKPNLKKLVCFKSLKLIEFQKPKQRYVVFPYISLGRNKLAWNNDIIGFDTLEQIQNFSNQFKITPDFKYLDKKEINS